MNVPNGSTAIDASFAGDEVRVVRSSYSRKAACSRRSPIRSS